MFTFLLLLSQGCDDAAELQRTANEAQQDANEKIADVRAEAGEDVREAQAAADRTIAGAVADFQTLRENYRHDKTTALVAIDERIAGLEAKALEATGPERVTLDASLASLRVRREAFAVEFERLDSATASEWDALKERLDAQWKALTDAVDAA